MSKGNYTHVQELFPEIKAMLASGKTQREVAEYFGFRDKYVVKKLVKRERAKQRKQEAGIEIRPKGRPRKDAGPRDIVTEIGVWKSNIPVLFFQLFILAYLWYDNSERIGGVQAMFSHVDPTLSLEKLRTNIEGQFFDRKSARIQARDFAHHLSAFANASGGLVVIGIEDNGSVTGVTENQENSFRQAAYDFLQTIPEYETEAVLCKTHSGEQKTILLFHISPSANEIIRLKNGEAFLRVGDQSRKLSADMLSSLEFSKGIKSYESKIVEDATYEDLDEKLIAQYTNLLDPSASSSFDLLKGRGIIKATPHKDEAVEKITKKW